MKRAAAKRSRDSRRRQATLWRVCATSFAAAVLLGACRPHDEVRTPETQAAQPVRVLVAKYETAPATEDVIGTARAKLRAAVEAKLSARIEALLVAPGQSVKKGELIAQLDAREIQAKLDQALAVREQATRDLARARELLANKVSTPAEFDSARAREQVAVGAAREMETMLGYTRLLAPFDGVVTRKLADVGDLAAPGRPVIELEDPSALRFEADVPEAFVGSVELGATYPVRLGAASSPMDGKVVEIAPVADAASRTFLVKLDLPPSAAARSGQFGRATIPTGLQKQILRVPASAVIARGQVELVFVAAENRAQLRLVRAGKRDADHVELLSGVAPGETVVIEGAEQLRDGQPITPKP